MKYILEFDKVIEAHNNDNAMNPCYGCLFDGGDGVNYLSCTLQKLINNQQMKFGTANDAKLIYSKDHLSDYMLSSYRKDNNYDMRHHPCPLSRLKKVTDKNNILSEDEV